MLYVKVKWYAQYINKFMYFYASVHQKNATAYLFLMETNF